MDGGTEATRVDRWLWAVRIYKTRTEATAACRAGRVRVNGTAAKPSTQVHPGDRVEVHVRDRHRDLEVVRAVERRVGSGVVPDCLVDQSPPAPKEVAPAVLHRDPGSGRPTKRERRLLDRARGR